MFFDWTIIIVIPAIILAAIAQARVTSAYNIYSKVGTRNGVTGYETARRILDDNGLQHVDIELVSGKMTDHYHPKKRVLRLSPEVYNGNSVASISIAAHEAGHALQHSRGYLPLKIRSIIAPLASFTSQAAIPLVIIGLIISGTQYYYWGPVVMDIGIIFYSLAVLFQVITLPVEFNASSRAIGLVTDMGIIYPDERHGAKKMLNAAALTYVAAMISSLLTLVRLLIIRGRD